MGRLVLVRVGDPDGLWNVCKMGGMWASPECHEQVVRNMFVEGYTVYALFVGTGDKLLMAAKITNVRELSNEDTLIPNTTEIGPLKTAIIFDPSEVADLRNNLMGPYQAAIDYVKYKPGSQILIPISYSEPILNLITSLITLRRVNTMYRGNYTVINPEYLLNLNISGC
jgi:hypothetical protein